MKQVLLAGAVCAAISSSGCARTARGYGEQFMSQAEIEAKDDATCRSYGAAKGTQPYVDCRLRLAQNRSSEASSKAMAGAIIAASP